METETFGSLIRKQRNKEQCFKILFRKQKHETLFFKPSFRTGRQETRICVVGSETEKQETLFFLTGSKQETWTTCFFCFLPIFDWGWKTKFILIKKYSMILVPVLLQIVDSLLDAIYFVKSKTDARILHIPSFVHVAQAVLLFTCKSSIQYRV